MSHMRIAFAGLDRAEEENIRSIFERANAASGGAFQTDSEDGASVVVVDVDSIHGHMTWLRLHNDPDRTVVAISTRETPHADHCIVRPVTFERFAAVLSAIAPLQGLPDTTAAQASDDPPDAGPAGAAHIAGEDAPPDAQPAGADAPQPEAPPPNPMPAAPQPPSPKRLGDYLVPGALPGPSRLAFPGAPDLVVDPGAQAYLGPAQLKGFTAYAQAGEITPDAWQPVDAGELASLAGTLGAPQPWGRLAWLAGLYGSPGAFMPGYGPGDRFGLNRWPQIEREFPRHFRIATSMMKAPATAAAIAEASGAPLEEVIDFINASLAAGHAHRVVETPPEEEPQAKGGLLGRLKGLRGN